MTGTQKAALALVGVATVAAVGVGIYAAATRDGKPRRAGKANGVRVTEVDIEKLRAAGKRETAKVTQRAAAAKARPQPTPLRRKPKRRAKPADFG